MYVALSDSAFSRETGLDEVIRRTANAGFSGIELTLGLAGPIGPSATADQCRQVAARVGAAGLKVAGVSYSLVNRALDGGSHTANEVWIDQIRVALEHAGWLGARTLLITDERVTGEGGCEVPCDEAWHRLREGGLDLRFDGEARGIVMAWCIRACSSSTPTEWREFVDELTTPWVGVGLEIDDSADRLRDVVDWIQTLGARIRALRLRSCTSSRGVPEPDDFARGWKAVLVALDRARFEGPVTILRCDHPERARERLALGIVGA